MPFTPPAALAIALALSASPASNAADDLLAAARAYQEPEFGVFEALEEPGGQAPPEVLGQALKANAAALERIHAGALKARCEFPPSPRHPTLGPEVPGLPLLKLGKLLVLRGRERLGRADRAGALGDFAAAFRLAGHLARAPDALARAVGAALEKLASASLESMAKTDGNGAALCAQLRAAFKEHQAGRPSAEDLVGVVRAQLRASAESSVTAAPKDPAAPPPEFSSSVMREYDALVDPYFDAQRAWATTRRPDSKQALARANERIRQAKQTAVERLERATDSRAAPGEELGRQMQALADAGLSPREIGSTLASILAATLVLDLTPTLDQMAQADEALARLEGAIQRCR